MSNETPQMQASPESSQVSTAGSCLGITLRLIMAIVLGIILAFVIFYGVPALYQRYILPFETSLAQLEDAQARQADENQRLSRRMDDFQNRLTALELQNDDSKQAQDEMQALLNNLESAQSTDDQSLEELQASLDEHIREVAQSIEEVNQALEELDEKLADSKAALSQTNEDIQELSQSLLAEDTPVATLRRELRLVMAMELITRSRILLVQNNLGLAQNDLQAARDLLADLQTRVPAYQVEALQLILDSLDAALENLPDSPILAAENMEISWQLLQRGLPDELPLSTASPTGETTATPTPTSSP